MSFLRTARQPMLRLSSRQTPTVAFTSRRAASGDYGSGTGDPVGENPQDQPKNPKEHMEHPGPEAPAVGKSSGGSKSGGSGQQSQQGGEQKPDSVQKSKGTQGAQPKIFNESPPAEGQGSKDVEDHNRDMDNRAEKAHSKVSDKDAEKDKVGKGFWSGTGGAEKKA
ncbi:hypothetical protein LTR65_010733 [Meristemomyces frigidus]